MVGLNLISSSSIESTQRFYHYDKYNTLVHENKRQPSQLYYTCILKYECLHESWVLDLNSTELREFPELWQIQYACT